VQISASFNIILPLEKTLDGPKISLRPEKNSKIDSLKKASLHHNWLWSPPGRAAASFPG
jgi:hypothetical protein